MSYAGTPIQNALSSAAPSMQEQAYNNQALQQQTARQRMIQAMMQPSQSSNTGWGGLSNAGSAIGGALAAKAMQNQTADPNYSTDMTRYGMTPQQIQSAATPGLASQAGSFISNLIGGGGS